MSIAELAFGSSAWVEQVFSTAPVRPLKGPSKPTQYHQLPSEHLGRYVGAQGRNEAHCLLVLEYLAKLGLINRFKEQPFRTVRSDFGYEIVPDYLAIDSLGKIYVVEAKSARYITLEVQAMLTRNREKFYEFDITYLVWTDRHPLNKHVRHSLIEMRRLSHEVSSTEISALEAHLTACRTTTFESLLDSGFDQGVVFAAAWSGRCHFKFTEEFRPGTIISAVPVLNLETIFLTPNGEGTGWWNALPNF